MGRMMKSNYLVIVGMIGIVVFCGDVVVGQCPSIEGLINECLTYVKKNVPQMKPSQECCAEVNEVNIPCVCMDLTKTVLTFIDIHKVYYVAESCGSPIPPDLKCGETLNLVSNSKSTLFTQQHQVPPVKPDMKPFGRFVQHRIPLTDG